MEVIALDRLRGLEGREEVWTEVGGRRSILCHQADLRRVRVSEEVREHGEGDGDEDIALQPVHPDESTWRLIPHSSRCLIEVLKFYYP